MALDEPSHQSKEAKVLAFSNIFSALDDLDHKSNFKNRTGGKLGPEEK